MALRMRRGLESDSKPEPIRKRVKYSEKNLSISKEELAEIDTSKTMTADEKRIAISKKILSSVMSKTKDKSEIHDKLQELSYSTEGKLRYYYGKLLRKKIQQNKNNIYIKSFRGHRLSVTCMALDNVFDNDPDKMDDNKYCVTGSKDGSIIKWDLNTGKILGKIFHAWPINKTGYSKAVYKKLRPKPVLCVAISPDNKWLVTGGEDKLIRVWKFDNLQYKNTFRGHNSAVTGLAFSLDGKESNTLFTTGQDRQIRVYDISEMGFAEPLYGHTMSINHIDSTTQDRCITVGDDKTIRYWKLRTQSQLIFENSHTHNIDTCCFLTPTKFISGGEDGNIIMWTTKSKKPLSIISESHISNNNKLKYWITSLGCKQNSDIFISGSGDGVIRIWLDMKNGFGHIRSIKIPKKGFVNCIKVNYKGNKIICGIGREHKFGRWMTVNGARNGICIVKLPVGAFDKEKGDDEDINVEDVKSGENDDEIKWDVAEHWDKWSKKDVNGGELVEKKVGKEMEKGGNDDEIKEIDDEDIDKNEWTDFFGEYFD